MCVTFHWKETVYMHKIYNGSTMEANKEVFRDHGILQSTPNSPEAGY